MNRPKLINGLLVLALATGLNAESYRVEAINMPSDVAPEVGDLDFTPEGELVVSLRRHGILMAKPTADATAFDWRVFAADSLHNPTGLDVISGSEVLVSQMQELTRITDTDGDGIGDLFENVADDWGVTGNYHETIAITRDGGDGWYLAIGTASHNGPTFYHTRGEFAPLGRTGRNFAAGPWKGWVVHADAEGNITPFAKGFRAHNGILRDAQGRLWATDNQGDWRGTSPLYHVEKDNFYGHPSSLIWDKTFTANISKDPLQLYIDDWDAYEAHRTLAAVEFPHGLMMNSPSEPIIDETGGSFGPFTGQMFIGDIAGPRITRVMLEEVAGEMQGACVTFISGEIGGGSNRLAFSPDGTQLYVGQTFRGWSRHNAEGLKRITFTGEPPFEVLNISLQKDGFRLTFTKPVTADVLSQLSHYSAQSYWYKSHHPYGSPQLDVTPLPVTAAKVSADGLQVDLTIPGIKPRRIVQLDLAPELVAQDGSKIDNPLICYTVRNLR
jgi:glucose/arabinose dehydrogenase